MLSINPVSADNKIIHHSPILSHIANINEEGVIPLTRCNSRQLHKLKDVVELERDLINSENTYKSCCISSDKRALAFFSQFTISISVLLFSFYKLINSDRCEDTQVYIGLITMIIGVYIPSPRMNNS